MIDKIAMEFFLGFGSDHRGRYIFEYIEANDEWLEISHDYIQWAFPNHEIGINPFAPLMSDTLSDFIRTNPVARHYALQMFARMLKFYGFRYVRRDGRMGLGCTDDFIDKLPLWTGGNNHNYLRITRILLFMKAIGEDRLASTFLLLLLRVNKIYNVFPDRTIYFWRKACI
jgi:hypothetical protein